MVAAATAAAGDAKRLPAALARARLLVFHAVRHNWRAEITAYSSDAGSH
jgi:hypothetical protein